MVDVAAIFDEVFGADADNPHHKMALHWTTEIDRLSKLRAVSPGGAETRH